MNRMSFQDIVKGQYGRKIAYADVDELTDDNILQILSDAIGVFNTNRVAIRYLWDYKKGDQPVRYRQKTIRDDICNVVVENHAWEIVAFKVGQTYGEPIQFVSLKNDDETNMAVDKLNDYMRRARKQVKDINCGEWQSAVGMGFKAVQKTPGSDIPFRIIAPTPMNTFVVYSRNTEEPLMAVQEKKDTDGKQYYHCFTDTWEYVVKSGNLRAFGYSADGQPVVKRLHGFSGIPIIEYPNNQDRVSDIELVIDLLDAVNNMQSNRMDSIEQFVQSWIKFVNCEVDEQSFKQMRMAGALVVKSNNGSENKADVDIMTQELNQTESQVAKDDLWDNALSILAIPMKQKGSDGGSTQGATELRQGWDFSKSRAKMKDPYVADAEMQLAKVVLGVIRVYNGQSEVALNMADFDVQINHSPTDNMQVKAQSLQMLMQSGVHPLVAIKTVGLWGDAEKVYLNSKPYLDAIYKKIDDVIAEIGVADQVEKAKQIVGDLNG